jgi:hypothetical protein
MKRTIGWTLLLLGGLVVAGCTNGTNSSPNDDKAAAVTVDKAKYLLAAEPAGSQGVVEVRDKAKDGDSVVVVGRIGGDKQPFFKGKAQFYIVDPQFKPCNEIEGDTCTTPWDYCCEPDLPKKMLIVRFADPQGEALLFDADKGLHLQPLQTVVVKGTMHKRDGMVAVLASGVFVKAK